MTVASALAVLLAATLDTAVGEPPVRLHPVVWFGKAVGLVDRQGSNARLLGSIAAVVLPLGAGLAVAGVVRLAGLVAPLAAASVAGLALFACLSLRMLREEASAVVAQTATDLPAARERLRSLAGREAGDLGAGEVRSAAVESAAENLADGLVAPLLAFALGATVSLPLAAGLAAWVKAVNTMDSMLGYRSKPAGWASARLDDLAMWIPARVAAVLVAVAAGRPGALVRAREYARVPDSPNAGWPMATMAACLGCRLRKRDAYDLFPGATFPETATCERGVVLLVRAGLLSFGLAAAWAWLAGGTVDAGIGATVEAGRGGGAWG